MIELIEAIATHFGDNYTIKGEETGVWISFSNHPPVFGHNINEALINVMGVLEIKYSGVENDKEHSATNP